MCGSLIVTLLKSYYFFRSKCQVQPMNVPDLSSEIPLIISGRYNGNFPDVLKARGIIADMTSYEMDLKVYNAKAIPLEKVRRQNFHALPESGQRLVFVQYAEILLFIVAPYWWTYLCTIFLYCCWLPSFYRYMLCSKSLYTHLNHGFWKTNNSKPRYITFLCCILKYHAL